ncbi:MAG: pyridoxamine 5'-phosphate oxidase family protein [Bacteroidales bacterium]|nr:pyridoxamine 5'-phosphate oxidase family protein [Bacteroidales bacterium]
MRKKEREIRDTFEIEEVIRESDVCRIAFANNDCPYIVTMNFGYRNDNGKRIYFHCSTKGKKLEMMDKNNLVCFEFDTGHILHEGMDACDYGMAYRSVVGWGRLSRVTVREEREEGLLSIMEHYSGRRDFSFRPSTMDRTLVLRLDITGMTGKRCP